MKLIKKSLKVITILILFALIIGGITIKYNLIKNKKKITPIVEENIIKEEVKEEIEEIKQVYVDIKGAVNKPGVYEIEDNKKVIDVIGLAGGFTDNADTSMINLAKKVTNEMVIIIYTKEEVKEATKPNQIIKYIDKECICPQIKNDACLNTSKESNTTQKEETTTNNNTQKININTASLEELQTLTGIGESKAKAIITYREENNGFKSIEDLKEVPGIGEALYEKIKNNITI